MPLYVNFKQFIARRLSQCHPSTNKSIDKNHKMNIQTHCPYTFSDEYKQTFENVFSLFLLLVRSNNFNVNRCSIYRDI